MPSYLTYVTWEHVDIPLTKLLQFLEISIISTEQPSANHATALSEGRSGSDLKFTFTHHGHK